MIHIRRADALARIEEAVTSADNAGYTVRPEERQDVRGNWYAWVVGTCPREHAFEMRVSKFLQGQRCTACRKEAQTSKWTVLLQEIDYDLEPELAIRRDGQRETFLVGTCSEGHPVRIRMTNLLRGERCGTCYLSAAEQTWLETARKEGYDVTVQRVLERGKQCPYLVGTCPNGHDLSIRASHFARGQRCPTCNRAARRQETAQRHLSLATKEGYTVTVERHPRRSDLLIVGTCPTGHPIEMATHTFASGARCNECRLERIRGEYLDLAQAEGFDVSIQMRQGRTQSTAWLIGHCPAGHPCAISISRFNNGGRCVRCARSGFNPGSPAHLYIVQAPQSRWGTLIQYGISNRVQDRLSVHRRSGFTDLAALVFNEDGALISHLERSIKQALASNGILTARKRGARFDGSTESFRPEDLPMSMFGALVAHLIERTGVPVAFEAVAHHTMLMDLERSVPRLHQHRPNPRSPRNNHAA